MEDKQFDKLLSICKHLSGRYPNIKGEEKEIMIYDLLMYLNRFSKHFENKGKFLNRKQLIAIGWNYIKPREPFQLGKHITIL